MHWNHSISENPELQCSEQVFKYKGIFRKLTLESLYLEQMKKKKNVVGKMQYPAKDVHTLIPRTYEYDILHDKKGLCRYN